MSEAETKKSQFQTLKDDENTNTIVVCKDWLEGNCPYTNETCMLGLHKYDLDKMPLCPFVRNNEKCPMIDNYCIYKHYRSQECSLYEFGFCPNGPLCPYRHVKRPSTAPLPHKMLIQQFLNSTPFGFLLDKPIIIIIQRLYTHHLQHIINIILTNNSKINTNIIHHKLIFRSIVNLIPTKILDPIFTTIPKIKSIFLTINQIKYKYKVTQCNPTFHNNMKLISTKNLKPIFNTINKIKCRIP